MALEDTTKISDLVETNPQSTDPVSKGDDHLRLIKKVLKQSFPSEIQVHVPDISGNSGKYLKVNSDSTSTEWSSFDPDSLIRRKGELSRARFEYLSGSSIKIYSGIYDLDARGSRVSWDSPITVTGLSGEDQWIYIYIDYSAVTEKTITEDQIISSSTPPVWSSAKHGWYKEEDRCIFAVYFSGTEISKWHHSGSDHVIYSEQINDALIFADGTWKDAVISGPAFASEVDITFKLHQNGGTTSATLFSYRVNGDSGDGHLIGAVEGGSDSQDDSHNSLNRRAFVDLITRKIQIHSHRATGADCIVYSNGWYFPGGM